VADNFNKFRDVYYDIHVASKKIDPLRCLTKATIIRKDTNESIARVQTWSDNNEDAMLELEKKLKPIIESLPRPPCEWNDLRIRQILITYRKFSDEITSAYVGLEKKRKSGNLSEDDLKKGLDAIHEMIKHQTIGLIDKINQFSEIEKQQLLVSSEDIYQNIFESSIDLDDACTREAIFYYILCPSPELIDLHKKHQMRMNSEFKSRASRPV
jgi:hypothetical protein